MKKYINFFLFFLFLYSCQKIETGNNIENDLKILIKNNSFKDFSKKEINFIKRNELYKLNTCSSIDLNIENNNFSCWISNPVPINLEEIKISRKGIKYIINGTQVYITGEKDKKRKNLIIDFNDPFGKIIFNNNKYYFYYFDKNTNFSNKIILDKNKYYYNFYDKFKQIDFIWKSDYVIYNNVKYENYTFTQVLNVKDHKPLDSKYFVLDLNNNDNIIIIEIINDTLNIIKNDKIFYGYCYYYLKE